MCVALLAILSIGMFGLQRVQADSDWGGNGTPKYGGVLIRPMPGDVNHLNLALDTDADEVIREMYSTLIKMDLNMQPHPDLAESWDISPDGKTYTWHLLHNATWHDGVPVTSADVKFSIEKIYPFGPPARAWVNLESVETPDDYTVVTRFNVPYPSLFLWLLDPAKGGCILPKHVFENDTTYDELVMNPASSAPIGSGPFMFKEWVRGDHITMVANPNYYYSDIPYLSEIIIKIIPDPNTAAMAFEAKELSLIDGVNLPLSRYSAYNARSDMRTWAGPSPPGNAYLYYNLRRSPLNNVTVRQAISYAINRETIRDQVFFGLATVGTSVIPSLVPGYNVTDVNIYTRDIAKANALLDAAGYPKGTDGKRFSTSLLVDTRDQYVKSAQILRDNLADVGIDLQIKTVDRATYFSLWYAWDFDMMLALPVTGTDASIHAYTFVTQNTGHTYSSNVLGYSNPQVDQLYEQATVEMNSTKRLEDWHEFQRTVAADCPVLPLYERPSIVAVWKDFDGVDIDGVLGMINDPDKHQWGSWTYWTQGSDVSAAGALKIIADAQLSLEDKSSQFYDVSQGLKKLAEARAAYNADDPTTWKNVETMASEAVSLATPPYLLYTLSASGWIVAVALGVFAWRFRKRR
jgi:peptide/nickel transport system substrate-binding protein